MQALNQSQQRYWEEFQYLIEILQRFGCLDNLVPTPLGIAAAIREKMSCGWVWL